MGHRSFLVTWRDERSGGFGSDIYGTRVNGAGGVLDGAGIAIATDAGRESGPAAAAGSRGTFGVVYQRFAQSEHYVLPRAYLRTVPPK